MGLPGPAINLLTKLQLDPSGGQVYLFVIGKGPNAGQRMRRANIWRDFNAIRRRAGLGAPVRPSRRAFSPQVSGRASPEAVRPE